MRNREFKSALAPYFVDLINEKRAMGFKYEAKEEIFLLLDRYLLEHNIETPYLTKDMTDEWCEKSASEAGYGQQKRIGALRHLSKYINSFGIPAYYPKASPKIPVTLPHLLSKDEINSLFAAIDSNVPRSEIRAFQRLSNEYKVLFRLLYCCGLRNSEASAIPTDCVDLNNGVLTIQSKGNKTRLVYLAEDLLELCRSYFSYISETLGFHPKYFFPAKNPEAPLPNTTVDAVFRKFWNRTEYAANCNNRPTPHDLRFTFITNKINQWSMMGYDIDVMMPYLSQYVGHSDIQETYYYYHISDATFDVIRKKDVTSQSVIPEAAYE